jgi:hypothetical protein
MIHGSADKAPPVVTLVLRVWRTGLQHGSSNPFRYEATHVQTGDVAYFRSIDRAAQHIQCLVERTTPTRPVLTPIEFPRHAANQEGPSDHVS